MKKLNISFINDNTKEDAILKIKDDSLSITTKDNSIIKIPFEDIKDYEYTQDEKLTIKRYHSSDIVIEVSFDITLINTLKEIVKPSTAQKETLEPPKKQEQTKQQFNTPLEKVTEHKENTEILNNQNGNNNSNNNSKIIIGVIIFIVGILIFYYYWNGVVHGNITHMNGCYIIDDALESDVSLCFDGSEVDYSYHGSSTTLNVKRLENSVYITNEYDDYMFTCEISTNDDNKMKCKSYNKALGSGSFYFVKE